MSFARSPSPDSLARTPRLPGWWGTCGCRSCVPRRGAAHTFMLLLAIDFFFSPRLCQLESTSPSAPPGRLNPRCLPAVFPPLPFAHSLIHFSRCFFFFSSCSDSKLSEGSRKAREIPGRFLPAPAWPETTLPGPSLRLPGMLVRWAAEREGRAGSRQRPPCLELRRARSAHGHLPGGEEAGGDAGLIYRHPKAQGKGEPPWHRSPASARLIPLAESLASR